MVIEESKLNSVPNSATSSPRKRKFVGDIASNEFLPKLQGVSKVEEELSSESVVEEGEEDEEISDSDSSGNEDSAEENEKEESCQGDSD